jgi:hypothetical protein
MVDHIAATVVDGWGRDGPWQNGPVGPPEIAAALVSLCVKCGEAHNDLEICVHLTDGTQIKDITDARKRGATTEIRTVSTVYHVVTTDICRLIHNII